MDGWVQRATWLEIWVSGWLNESIGGATWIWTATGHDVYMDMDIGIRTWTWMRVTWIRCPLRLCIIKYHLFPLAHITYHFVAVPLSLSIYLSTHSLSLALTRTLFVINPIFSHSLLGCTLSLPSVHFVLFLTHPEWGTLTLLSFHFLPLCFLSLGIVWLSTSFLFFISWTPCHCSVYLWVCVWYVVCGACVPFTFVRRPFIVLSLFLHFASVTAQSFTHIVACMNRQHTYSLSLSLSLSRLVGFAPSPVLLSHPTQPNKPSFFFHCLCPPRPFIIIFKHGAQEVHKWSWTNERRTTIGEYPNQSALRIKLPAEALFEHT